MVIVPEISVSRRFPPAPPPSPIPSERAMSTCRSHTSTICAPLLGLQSEGWLKVFRFCRFKFLSLGFQVVVENFMDISNNLERVGTV